MQTDEKRLEDEHFEMMYINKLKISKIEKIEQCIKKFHEALDDEDRLSAVQELRTLGRSEHGFVNTELRAKAWPILLNVYAIVQNLPDISWPLKDSTEWKQYLKDYADKHQVEVDVKRTLHNFDVCKNWTDEYK